ncbi:MAG: bacillithiol biosynthesis cysteine-adding enzyme BshC [Acidobacteria bacterium]|nr:bacillithiol biosynthesis cysteine-adding enzyme BshC [Acidobacteriota bacterium]
MKSFALNHSQIPGRPKLFLEFLRLDSVRQFYNSYHRGCSAIGELARYRQNMQFPRDEICTALQDFNVGVGNAAVALSNVQKLSQEGVLAVITGQQAGLFGGPALSFYKAITAILLARKLSEEGFPTVPLFWVASEDHDFEEIRQTTFIDRDARLFDLRLQDVERAPLPAAQRNVGEQGNLFQRLAESLQEAEYGRQVLEWIHESYRGPYSMSEAFARLLARVLGKYGLVLLDASDPAVRRLSSKYYVQAIEQTGRVQELLESRANELRSAGFQPQVHWARDYTLLFYVDSSGRRAIRNFKGRFRAGDRSWTTKELVEEITQHPSCFSPSVLLRPVIQDAILPSAIYVGGPAEISYFAQVQALTGVFGWVPVIEPRLSVILLDPRACRYLGRNRLQVTDLFCRLEELEEKIVLHRLDPAIFEAWNQHDQNAKKELDSLLGLATRVDPTIAIALQTSRKKIDYQLNKIRKKMLRLAAEKDRLLKSQANYLHNLVYPGGVLQERKINFLSFYARYGPALLESLFSVSPCEKVSHVVMVP